MVKSTQIILRNILQIDDRTREAIKSDALTFTWGVIDLIARTAGIDSEEYKQASRKLLSWRGRSLVANNLEEGVEPVFGIAKVDKRSPRSAERAYLTAHGIYSDLVTGGRIQPCIYFREFLEGVNQRIVDKVVASTFTNYAIS
ncbi:MAG: hypothetical protein ABIE22_01625 [archaeon]